jgi:hypothetical protein
MKRCEDEAFIGASSIVLAIVAFVSQENRFFTCYRHGEKALSGSRRAAHHSSGRAAHKGHTWGEASHDRHT